MKTDIASENPTTTTDDSYAPPRVELFLSEQDLERETLYAGGSRCRRLEPPSSREQRDIPHGYQESRKPAAGDRRLRSALGRDGADPGAAGKTGALRWDHLCIAGVSQPINTMSTLPGEALPAFAGR
jgi:hypothetical protein